MRGFEDSYLRIFEEKNMLKTGGKLYKIPSNEDKGFNFEYLLFIPNNVKSKTTLLFESMNYSANKDFNEEEAIDYLYESFKSFRNPIHYVNQNTAYPILYPLIPRYYDKNLNKEIYTIQLSSSCFSDKILPKYKRIDIQILNMIEDAKDRLRKNDIEIEDKIIINGFSASAKFANRFTLLHPHIVKLVIAGGLGGCLALPLKEMNKEELFYPVGVGNLKCVTGEMLEEFKSIKQFYFQGNNDEVDAFKAVSEDNFIPYFKGIIETDELKQLYKIFGRNIKDRWKKTQELYKELNCNVVFKSYDSEHNYTDEIICDIKELLENEVKTLYK